jgi:hypothetical protein
MTTTIEDNVAYIDAAQDQAVIAIDLLTAAAADWSYSVITETPTVVTIGTVTSASGTKPALQTLTLPTFTPVSFAGVITPPLPTPPSLTGADTVMWSETYWTNLKTKLAAFTDSITGADDVDSCVTELTSDLTKMNSALYAKDYERKTQVLRDLYSAADVGTGAKGFTYPNSMTTALRMEAQQKFQFDMSQTARDLIVNIFEWAKSVQQFSLQQGISAHNADVDFNMRYIDATVKVYAATVEALVDKYKADVEAFVAQFEANVKAFKAESETLVERAKVLNEIAIADARQLLDVSKSQADIDIAKLRVEVDEFNARVNNWWKNVDSDIARKDTNAKNRIAAAGAAAQAAQSMASTAGNIVLTTVAGTSP